MSIFHTSKPLNSVLIKPAGPDCNLNCRYCFYLEKSELFNEQRVHRMNSEVLEETIKQVMQQGGSYVNFGWQGGEPTLMGVPFFKKAVEFQRKYGRNQEVANGLQTNGILIDKSWSDFLKDSNFLVGLSLDGPEHIHDRYRFNRGKGGSWREVMKSARLMLDDGVAVNALSVVNDYSVRFAEETYRFLKELGFEYMQFIPVVETDPDNPERAADYSVSAEAYGKFLTDLFDLWLADFRNGKPTISIRFFDSVFHTYVGFTPPECTLLHTCGQYLVIEHNGEVYSCDFFVEPEWKLGNVMKGNLSDMLNSSRQMEFGDLKARLPEACKNCPWLQYCRGGCTKDRLRDPQDGELNHFCRSFQMFFEHAHEQMSRLAENWKREQEQQSRRESVLAAVRGGEIQPDRNDPCPCGSGKKYKKCCGA